MKSPKGYGHNHNTTYGFTLLEMLVVMGVVSVLFAMSAIAGIDTIARSTVASERDLLVSLLETARMQALANIHESPHGVHVSAATFVVFEGASFDPSDPLNRSVPRETAVSVSGSDDIIFEQLSGDVTDEGVMTLSDSQSSMSIDINDNGRIEW